MILTTKRVCAPDTTLRGHRIGHQPSNMTCCLCGETAHSYVSLFGYCRTHKEVGIAHRLHMRDWLAGNKNGKFDPVKWWNDHNGGK